MKLNVNAALGRRGRAAGVWAAGATALALVAAACGSSSSTGASGGGNSSQPITIGVSVSLSGDFSGDGLATKQGYQTWAAYQNAHGGIMGRQVKMDFLSDGSSPTQVVTNYQKLITVDHVNYVMGPYSTLLTKPSAAIANRYGDVMIEGIGGGPSVFQQGLKNVFDVSASATFQLITFAKWLATQPTTTVAYASMTDPFLQPMVDGARAYLTAHGFKSVLYKLYPVETTDFTPIASAIAASKAPVVVIGSMPPDGYALIQDLIQDKYSPKILIEASGPDQGTAFVKAVGAKNTGGLMVPNTWFPGSTYYQNTAMVQQYLKMFGGTADNISADVAEAFASGQVLTQAVDHVKSTSNSDLQNYLHSNVTFQSVQGPVKFQADGENSAATPFVFQWQKGTLQDVLPAGVGNPVPVLATKPAWGAGG
jgi:branched-chain amino acid transport system substrate-binding protein